MQLYIRLQMKKLMLKGLTAVFMFPAICLSAQNLQINEVMVNNQNNYVDHYGKKSSWIEIYNNSGATANLGGWYLSDDPNNLKKYPITKGDRNTIIGPRQFHVFWADGNALYGTFHTNFTLDPNRRNEIYLSDPSGKLIDYIAIPAEASAKVDLSYGRISDGGSEIGLLKSPTPNINNKVINQDAASEKFKKNDPSGIGMTATAILVVFIALILLYIAFKWAGKLHIRHNHRKKAAQGILPKASEDGTTLEELSGELVAAIATVVYQIQNQQSKSHHDIEDMILTIERRVANYSPWSSKIYSLRQLPQLKK
jgi:Na+-transporting methylmalonyl-CoA/oxaloacetate decarboxylase gamma subunit